MSTQNPQIVTASGSWLTDSCGRRYLDLCMGYGSVWLGHNHSSVTAAVRLQLGEYAAPGFLGSPTVDATPERWQAWLPDSHFLAGIYSTGMEAMETAIRVAWAHTGHRDIVGFRGSTHGRSFLTSALVGTGDDDIPTFVHTLPGFGERGEVQQVDAFRALMGRVTPAAIVVEPVQMTGGGFALPYDLRSEIAEHCARCSIPLLFDESLTGLHRCGRRFWFERMRAVPDILVIGKGMANGFPCAGLVLRRGIGWSRESVKPGSTFWNHPLACAAANATLAELCKLDVETHVRRLEEVVHATLGHLVLRGEGALWTLAVPEPQQMPVFVGRLQAAGVIASYYHGHMRLLPAVTMAPELLADACDAIRNAYATTFG